MVVAKLSFCMHCENLSISLMFNAHALCASCLWVLFDKIEHNDGEFFLKELPMVYAAVLSLQLEVISSRDDARSLKDFINDRNSVQSAYARVGMVPLFERLTPSRLPPSCSLPSASLSPIEPSFEMIEHNRFHKKGLEAHNMFY